MSDNGEMPSSDTSSTAWTSSLEHLASQMRAARDANLRPPPRLTVTEWADRYRRLSPESSAEPGQWRTSRAPYLAGIMDALSDPDIEEVVVMSSAQVGKTETLNNIIGFFVSQDPAPLLMVQPTLEMAESWSKDRLAPMVRDTPVLQGLIADPRARDSGNTMLHKVFPGGHVTVAGANSPSSLASRPVRVVLCDEVDRYPLSAGTEGDPVDLARARTKNFWNRKVVLTSTPTVEGLSRIESAWQASDQRRYHVPCPHCDALDVLKWANVRWLEGAPKAATYLCEHCGGVIEDRHKPAMLQVGEWRASSEFHGVAGFHLNELYSPWRRFGEVASDFVKAKRAPETLRVWVNTSLGETWKEQAAEIETSTLQARAEDYPLRVVPEGGALVLAAVDVQDNRLEWGAWAYGPGEESWVVDHAVIYGDPARPQVWADLEGLMQRPLEHASGGEVPVFAVAVDSGGHHTQAVYRFARKWQARRVIAVKGQSQPGKPVIGRPANVEIKADGKAPRGGAQVWPVGADTAKSTIYSRLKISEPGPGCMHFSAALPPEFFDQITAEKLVTRMSRGVPRQEWVLQKGRRNEALDLAVYAYAAFSYSGAGRWRPRDWERLRAATIRRREPPELPPDAAEQAPPAATQQTTERPAKRGPFSFPRRRGGFATNW